MKGYPFEREIGAAAGFFCLPEALVAAVCEAESGFTPWAVRHEPAFRARYVLPWLGANAPEANPLEVELLASSLGIMQVMGLVAVELGLPAARLTELFVPERGLWFGCRKLRQLARLHGGRIQDAVSAYNAGSVRRGRDGRYSNQAYVDRVTERMRAYEA